MVFQDLIAISDFSFKKITCLKVEDKHGQGSEAFQRFNKTFVFLEKQGLHMWDFSDYFNHFTEHHNIYSLTCTFAR